MERMGKGGTLGDPMDTAKFVGIIAGLDRLLGIEWEIDNMPEEGTEEDYE